MTKRRKVDELLTIRAVGNVTIITLERDRDLDAFAHEDIHASILAVIEEFGCQRLLFDFTSVTYCSSMFVGTIVAATKAMETRQGKVGMFALRRDIRELFRLTKLDSRLAIFEDEAAALAAMN